MPPLPIKTFWQTLDGSTKLYQGDVIDVLNSMPARSVHCIVTSPPYWNLRDYGTGMWKGGDKNCDHLPSEKWIHDNHLATATINVGHNTVRAAAIAIWTRGGVCRRCGARRIDRQIGTEKLADCLGWARGKNCAEDDWGQGCYVCRMVLVCRALHRVLRDDGTFWLNIGDYYSKGLTGVPWRVALALQADGWILRQDLIWAKPSPMPESMTNRCTKAHEYVFLFVKRSGYFYDAEAIKEPSTSKPHAMKNRKRPKAGYGGANNIGDPDRVVEYKTANKRSVWFISPEAYSGAHFATFPTKLVEPCILAGTSKRGCCAECGAPWRRVVEKRQLKRDRPNEYVKCSPRVFRDDSHLKHKATGHGGVTSTLSNRLNTCANTVDGVEAKTVGWEPTCECCGKQLKKRIAEKVEIVDQDGNVEVREVKRTIKVYKSKLPLNMHEVVPCVILDPFVGSGTSCYTAIMHSRRSIGIDLSEKYLRNNAVPRIEGGLLAKRMDHLISRKRKSVGSGRKLA